MHHHHTLKHPYLHRFFELAPPPAALYHFDTRLIYFWCLYCATLPPSWCISMFLAPARQFSPVNHLPNPIPKTYIHTITIHPFLRFSPSPRGYPPIIASALSRHVLTFLSFELFFAIFWFFALFPLYFLLAYFSWLCHFCIFVQLFLHQFCVFSLALLATPPFSIMLYLVTYSDFWVSPLFSLYFALLCVFPFETYTLCSPLLC